MNASILNFMPNEFLSCEVKDQNSSKENDKQYYKYGNVIHENKAGSSRNGGQTLVEKSKFQEISVKSKRNLKEPIDIQNIEYKTDSEHRAIGTNSLSSVEKGN